MYTSLFDYSFFALRWKSDSGTCDDGSVVCVDQIRRIRNGKDHVGHSCPGLNRARRNPVGRSAGDSLGTLVGETVGGSVVAGQLSQDKGQCSAIVFPSHSCLHRDLVEVLPTQLQFFFLLLWVQTCHDWSNMLCLHDGLIAL